MCVGRGGWGVLSFLHPIPKIPRISIARKNPLNPGHRLLAPGWAPLLPSQPTGPAQTKSFPPGRGCHCLTSPSPAWPQNAVASAGKWRREGRQAGGRALGDQSGLGGCWDTGWGNKLRSAPRCHRRSWPRRYQSAPTPCLPSRQMVFI